MESEDRAEPKQDIEVVDEADASLDLAESSNVAEQSTEEPVKSLSSLQSSPSSSSCSLLKPSKPSSEDLLPALSPPSATKVGPKNLKRLQVKPRLPLRKNQTGPKVSLLRQTASPQNRLNLSTGCVWPGSLF